MGYATNMWGDRMSVLSVSSAIAICVALSAPAMAQEDTQQTTAVEPASQASAAPASNKPELGDIVVTASKRSLTVNKTAIAVTALGQEQLQAAGVLKVQDLTSAVPNVQIHTLGPAGYTGIAIRGISNQDFSQFGSPAVATYLDGVYVATSQSLPGGLYDLERMEVLRGPQGTTYGLNATGGSVNIITADPKHSFGASADLSYGNYNDVQAHAMVNLPVSDTLAIRGGFFLHRSDGVFDNRGTIARDYGTDDVIAGRLSVLWTPSDAFKWKVVLERFINQGTPPNMLMEIGPDGRPATGRPVFDQPIFGPTIQPKIDLKSIAVRSRMDLQISDTLSAAYIAGYQHQKSTYDFAILGAGSVNVYDGRWVDKVESFSNEINLNFESDRFTNILGASQFKKTNPYSNAFHFYIFGVDQYFPGYAQQTAVGIFDQATFRLLDNVRVIGGLRWSRESQNSGKSFDTINCSAPSNPYRTIEEIQALTISTPGCGPITRPYLRDSWSNISWKGGLEWDVNARTLAYATVTNGFKSGQIQPQVAAGIPTSVSPEELTNYEIGLKTRLLDNTLNLRSAFYYMDYKNIQVTKVGFIDGSPAVFSQNAGSARVYGTELELTYEPTSVDRLNAFVSYTHATYTDYTNAFDGVTGGTIPSLKGKFLPNAPEFNAKIEYSHDFKLENGGTITPMASLYYQTKSYLREFNNPIDRVPAYTKTNLNLTYTSPSERWKLTAFVTNLENKKIRQSANTAVNRYFSDYLMPRLFGVRASYSY